MNEKKILIFEDDWSSIKGSFDLANIYAFGGNLKFHQVSKSQEIRFLNWRTQFSLVFIDITLAKHTQMDGFNIVKKIIDSNLFELNKVVVMTGNNKVEEKFKAMQLDISQLKILYKPVAFDDLAKLLQELL